MRFMCPMLVVADMDKSVAFYERVLGLQIAADFGANKTLTGGLALQTAETYRAFIGTDAIAFGGNASELYFEEEDFDGFVDKLSSCDVEYVHPVMEHAWGQRVVRFYDPDRHIIEVGEDMKAVCQRFLNQGMTLNQAAERMGVPTEFVLECLNREQRSESDSADALESHLQEAITDGMSLPEIVDAFERMCQIPMEDSMILFETGVYDFTGEPLFYFSLVRQFPGGDGDEFLQLHANVLYRPTPENKAFWETVWDDDLDGDIFDHIRSSPAYAWAKDHEYDQVEVYLDET